MKLIFATTLLFLSGASHANDVSFSIGGGYPYVAVPEISLATNEGTQRWYANYKIGLDDGFSAGFEHALTSDKKHAVGFVVGALGVQDDGRQCPLESEDDSIGDAFGNIFGCALSGIFDRETTNGVGVSYSYLFSGLNEGGWRVRLELGYGEGTNSNESRADGGVSISYEF
ncbi:MULTISPECIES: hypothetical protein [Pseudoalteromonas]|uniref:Outer membrane protein beta-barrel domain-containing protein n=1 Tax=Pseudoalteromonas porphyrae TaxID=187330 RepID=A0A0N1EZG2_9GAMM|nr:MULTISPECIES: hypothetical protein [Pseudoalteromonas]KPH64565.1 hypothetical protein ADS77_04610 [Pseudoalteromonas porphyrae]NMR26677.1 hypothetical protein [Pseudoalteromonas sp. NEC-BIFX-2020_015]